MLDLQQQYREIKTEIDAVVHVVLNHNRFIPQPQVAALRQGGMESAIYYPVPFDRQQALMGRGAPLDTLPITKARAREVLSPVMFPELKADEITRIGDIVDHAL